MTQPLTHNLLLLRSIRQTGVPKRTRSLFQSVERLLYPLDILEPELGLYNFHIAEWIDIAFDMDDFGVVECADDLEDTVH